MMMIIVISPGEKTQEMRSVRPSESNPDRIDTKTLTPSRSIESPSERRRKKKRIVLKIIVTLYLPSRESISIFARGSFRVGNDNTPPG